MRSPLLPAWLLLMACAGCASAPVPAQEHPKGLAVEEDLVVLFDVSPEALQVIIAQNGLQALEAWPPYYQTNYAYVEAPECLRRRAAQDPPWKVLDLGQYRITSITKGGRRIGFLYDQQTQTLIVTWRI